MHDQDAAAARRLMLISCSMRHMQRSKIMHHALTCAQKAAKSDHCLVIIAKTRSSRLFSDHKVPAKTANSRKQQQEEEK
jgi:hypothetical protein